MKLCKHCRHSRLMNRPAITDPRRMSLYCDFKREWAEPACDQWEREAGIDDECAKLFADWKEVSESPDEDITEPRA